MANEMRLIDAKPLMQNGWHLVQTGESNRFIQSMSLADIPTVDAKPVVHGRWIPLEYDGFADGNPVLDLWECSECQEEHSGDEDTLTPYCPNCGAKMDGGNEDG